MYRITLVFCVVVLCVPLLAQEIQPSLSQVAMVVLKFTRVDDSTHISVSQAKVIETSKQRVTSSSGKWSDHDYVCMILDDNMLAIDTLVVHQPLRPRYEYAQENGTIESTTVQLEENVMTLRFLYVDRIRYLKVFPVIDARLAPTAQILPLKFHD